MTTECTQTLHESWKADRSTFELRTRAHEVWDSDPEHPLLVGQCRACNSTLALELRATGWLTADDVMP